MSDLLNVNRFLPLTEAEGPGRRSCVWLQGCDRHCPGCFAEEMWDHEPRLSMAPGEIIERTLAQSGVEGITMLGGEPFEQPGPLADLLELAWSSHLTTLVFTGYTCGELRSSGDTDVSRALSRIDVLVDGPYIRERPDAVRPLVGSENQRFWFLTDRYSMDDFIPNRIEVRIGKDGSVALNGMGPISELRRLLDHPSRTPKKE